MADAAVAAREHAVAGRVGIRGTDIVARVIARWVRIDPVPRPATRLLGLDQPCDRRARDEYERDALLDVGQLCFPGTHERRAHRAGLLARSTEHIAVDHERRLPAEQV